MAAKTFTLTQHHLPKAKTAAASKTLLQAGPPTSWNLSRATFPPGRRRRIPVAGQKASLHERDLN